MNAFDLIDIATYPINGRGTAAYDALVQRCQAAFTDEGAALLPGFLTTQALAAMLEESEPLVSKAFFCRNNHNVYLGRDPNPEQQDALDPAISLRSRWLRTDVGSVANDYLDPAGPLQQLYELPALTRFIADVVGADELFISADPLGAVSINVFAPDDGHAWHFDESRFTVTLMVRPATIGGVFEYVPGLRDEGDGDTTAITQVLDGDLSAVQQMPFEAGTLSIFAGRHTMHRVTTVHGDEPRLVPVLTYADTPGYRNSDSVREFFWGRVG